MAVVWVVPKKQDQKFVIKENFRNICQYFLSFLFENVRCAHSEGQGPTDLLPIKLCLILNLPQHSSTSPTQ